MTTEHRQPLPSRREIHHPRRRKRTREPRTWTGATMAISTMALTTAVATTLSPAGADASPTAFAGPPVQPGLGALSGSDLAPKAISVSTAVNDPALTKPVSQAGAALARADYLAGEAYGVPASQRAEIAAAAQALRELVVQRSGTTERASRAGDRKSLATRTVAASSKTKTSTADPAATIEAATAQLTALLDQGEHTAAEVIDPGPPTAAEVLADQVQAGNAASDELSALARSTAGYSNGYIPSDLLCELSFARAHELRCDAAAQLERLDAAFQAYFGRHLEITDSYRSYSAQTATRAAKGSLAAVPGTSNHGWGLAVDLGGGAQQYGTSVYLWLRENAPKFGWDNPDWARSGGSKPEPWHWEYTAP